MSDDQEQEVGQEAGQGTGQGAGQRTDEGADGPARGAESGGAPAGERDFGDSAGYGHGGSALDYREVTGEEAERPKGPNPLDTVVRTDPGTSGGEG